jgi:hypothetical protein
MRVNLRRTKRTPAYLKGFVSDLDRFVSEQNMTRYRTRLDDGTEEDERRTILKLLTEQMAKPRRP